MKIQHSTASCKVNFNAGYHMPNTPLTPKKVVKLTAKPELSVTCRICKLYLKLQSVIAGRKTSTFPTEIFFKIPQRAGVASIPLAALLKTHLGVEVDPQDGKSLRVCVK